MSELLTERGLKVDASCMWRWVQAYAPELNKRCRRHPKGERLILTDTDIAVVRLNRCNNPKAMPGVDAMSGVDPRGRLSRGLGSLRNDLRLNIFFTTYNTLKLVTERRALKPLRKAPSIDANPPGLDWLSSLPTGRATSSSATSAGRSYQYDPMNMELQ